MNNKYTNNETSKQLKDWGCSLESEHVIRYKSDMKTAKLVEVSEIKNTFGDSGFETSEEMFAYDLIYDVCIKYAKELFPHLTKGQLRTVRTVIIEALEKGDETTAKNIILENTIFNPVYCKCKSYNAPKDYQVNNEVVLKNKEMTGKESVCIDKCIVSDIKRLWDNNIPTLNSCCGHNHEFGNKSIVVDKKYSQQAKELLPELDVIYWEEDTLKHTIFNPRNQ